MNANDFKDPAFMSARERVDEVAAIFAAGLARLRKTLVNNLPRRDAAPSTQVQK